MSLLWTELTAPGSCFIQVGDNCPATERQLRCCGCPEVQRLLRVKTFWMKTVQMGLEDELASDGQKGSTLRKSNVSKAHGKCSNESAQVRCSQAKCLPQYQPLPCQDEGLNHPLGRMSPGAKWAMEKRRCNQTFLLRPQALPGQAEGREPFMYPRH